MQLVTTSESRMDDVKALYEKGLTYGQISKELGLTRCTIAGVIRRLKKKGSVKCDRLRLPPVVIRKPKPKPDPKAVAKPSEVDGSEFMDLRRDQCRFPIRSEGTKHWFCTSDKIEGSSYCAYHSSTTRTPSKPRVKLRGHYR